jgi:uncharacterized protein YccT (UPF0319 family)
MTPTTGACTVMPDETGGPYPADGTNAHGGSIINVLKQSGVVRSDIRASFNGATGVAAGVPLTIKLQLLNASGSCASLAKAASASNRLKTSQFTFPMATLNDAYAASGYTASVRNLAQISYATDNVFSGGSNLQMAPVTGNATQGYVVTLSIAVNA